MQDTIRLFVAVPLPESLKNYLVQAREVYEVPGIRAVPADNLHLTLFFLGNVPAPQLSQITTELQKIADAYEPFSLDLEQLEPGPKPTTPRLVWARFQENEAFSKISKALTSALAESPPKQEKFIPHITLCRFKKEARPSRNLPISKPEEEIIFPVQSFALWQSTLGSPHPTYTVLQEFALGKG
jgi:2'-5' RNA ligase